MTVSGKWAIIGTDSDMSFIQREAVTYTSADIVKYSLTNNLQWNVDIKIVLKKNISLCRL